MGTLANLEERTAVIEERVSLIPEMRNDIKSLLAFMNKAQGFGSASGMFVTKALAVGSLVVAVIALIR